MGKYFECNLPTKAPYWLHASATPAFQQMLNAVHSRMDKLNDALELTGLDGATFAKHAKVLFDGKGESFDKYEAEEIAQFVLLMDDGTTAEPRMEWPNATVIVDTAFVLTKEWESIRHFGIGGSDAAVVQGISPYNTATALYHSKMGTPVTGEEEDHQWVFDRGHILEDRVVSAFCKLTGAKVIPETRMFASKKHPHCTANIDAIISVDHGRKIYVFEAKTTIRENWQAWANDKIPRQYVPQTRQYPAVLDDDRILGTYIGCIFTDDIIVANTYVGSQFDESQFVARFVDRNLEEEKELLEAEEDWFTTYVENNEAPPLTGDPQSVIKTILQYAEEVTTPVKNLPEWELESCEADIERYLAKKEEQSLAEKRAKELKDSVKTIEAQLIDRLGASTKVNVDIDGEEYYEVKNSPRSQTKVDKETLQTLFDASAQFLPEELLNSMRDCIKTNPDSFRVFSVKKKRYAKKKTA